MQFNRPIKLNSQIAYMTFVKSKCMSIEEGNYSICTMHTYIVNLVMQLMSGEINKVYNEQKKAARLICKSSYRVNYDNILKDYKINSKTRGYYKTRIIKSCIQAK